MNTINILITDDRQDYCDSLTQLISSVESFRVVGQATSGEAAVELASKLQPDVVIMDLQMPEAKLNGIKATRQIVDANPHIRVLVFTFLHDDVSIFSAMRAGARGYLLKGADRAEIIRAVEAVRNNEGIFSPTIIQRIIDYFSKPSPLNLDRAFPELSDREYEVLELMARGFNNVEIAEQFDRSPHTIANHVWSILTKLQVRDRHEAIIKAVRNGLGDSPEQSINSREANYR